MRTVVLTLSLFIAPLLSAAADSSNYCFDPETNATWSGMFRDSPDDDLVARLFALRLGLCELVRRDAITLERATEIFEAARARGVSERKTDLLRERMRKGGDA